MSDQINKEQPVDDAPVNINYNFQVTGLVINRDRDRPRDNEPSGESESLVGINKFNFS